MSIFSPTENHIRVFYVLACDEPLTLSAWQNAVTDMNESLFVAIVERLECQRWVYQDNGSRYYTAPRAGRLSRTVDTAAATPAAA